MKKLQNLLFVVLFFLVSVSGYAQSVDKQKEKATELTEALNTKLKVASEELALTKEQYDAILLIYTEGQANLATASKDLKTPEEKKEAQKPIRQEMNKKVNQEILTKEQRKALYSKKD